MDASFHGICDHCGKKVAARHHAFSRHVERAIYPILDIPVGPQTIHVEVLHAEELARYCCSKCAEIGAYCQLADRGIVLGELGSGPITPCSKCGQPMDLREPHVAYEMMNQTESGPPWLLSAEPHESALLARICTDCQGSIAGEIASTDFVNRIGPVNTSD